MTVHTFLRRDRFPEVHHRRLYAHGFKAKVARDVALIFDTDLDIQLLATDLRCEIAQIWDAIPEDIRWKLKLP